MQGVADEVLWRAASAFILVALLVPLSLPVSRRLGMHDVPGGRKQHEAPTSYIGGMLILAAIAVCFLAFDREVGRVATTFLACSAFLMLVGLADDRFGLGWKSRISAQAITALVMIYVAGVRVENLGDVFGLAYLPLGLLSVPFTIFIVVGVINALNMIDGSDGLAGGQALVSLVLFSAFAHYAGNVEMFERLLIVAAAVAGFLVWNLRLPWQPRARIFLGNAGSMVLGFIIAWAAVRLTQNSTHPVSPVLGPWTIAIPLIDCVALMFRRMAHGGSPFKADRNHLHHLLLDAGYQPMSIAWGLMLASLVLGLCAGVAVQQGAYRPALVIVFLVMLAGYYALTRDRERAVAWFRSLRWNAAGAPDEPTPAAPLEDRER